MFDPHRKQVRTTQDSRLSGASGTGSSTFSDRRTFIRGQAQIAQLLGERHPNPAPPIQALMSPLSFLERTRYGKRHKQREILAIDLALEAYRQIMARRNTDTIANVYRRFQILENLESILLSWHKQNPIKGSGKNLPVYIQAFFELWDEVEEEFEILVGICIDKDYPIWVPERTNKFALNQFDGDDDFVIAQDDEETLEEYRQDIRDMWQTLVSGSGNIKFQNGGPPAPARTSATPDLTPATAQDTPQLPDHKFAEFRKHKLAQFAKMLYSKTGKRLLEKALENPDANSEITIVPGREDFPSPKISRIPRLQEHRPPQLEDDEDENHGCGGRLCNAFRRRRRPRRPVKFDSLDDAMADWQEEVSPIKVKFPGSKSKMTSVLVRDQHWDTEKRAGNLTLRPQYLEMADIMAESLASRHGAHTDAETSRKSGLKVENMLRSESGFPLRLVEPADQAGKIDTGTIVNVHNLRDAQTARDLNRFARHVYEIRDDEVLDDIDDFDVARSLEYSYAADHGPGQRRVPQPPPQATGGGKGKGKGKGKKKEEPSGATPGPTTTSPTTSSPTGRTRSGHVSATMDEAGLDPSQVPQLNEGQLQVDRGFEPNKVREVYATALGAGDTFSLRDTTRNNYVLKIFDDPDIAKNQDVATQIIRILQSGNITVPRTEFVGVRDEKHKGVGNLALRHSNRGAAGVSLTAKTHGQGNTYLVMHKLPGSHQVTSRRRGLHTVTTLTDFSRKMGELTAYDLLMGNTDRLSIDATLNNVLFDPEHQNLGAIDQQIDNLGLVPLRNVFDPNRPQLDDFEEEEEREQPAERGDDFRFLVDRFYGEFSTTGQTSLSARVEASLRTNSGAKGFDRRQFDLGFMEGLLHLVTNNTTLREQITAIEAGRAGTRGDVQWMLRNWDHLLDKFGQPTLAELRQHVQNPPRAPRRRR
ncbi:hypothetical protein FUAX_21710 [Fulvitalea axinellae]|uniref:Uncharacterized protein n=1 Tax=Fulvitalea axinellae TaxID=1182444 RepID=A0AAU9D5I9_9BACT|nr:hypothetical protein FUAX_21710 [Fulvitalea axinellae]